MSIQNPSDLYTGGQGIFNSMPYMQFAMQQQAKKQAKAEALNQYFDKLRGDINEAGARTIDMGGDGKSKGILDEIGAWQNHWKSNKDAIQKGGAARQESDNMYANILRQVEKSKGRAQFQLEMGKDVAHGKFDPDEEDIKGVMTETGKSIYDKTSYKEDGVSDYGWGDLSPAIPDYDLEKRSKIFDATSKGIDPGKKYDYSKMTTNPITKQAIVPFVEGRTPEQIKAIGALNRSLTDGNSELAKSARKYYNKILQDPGSPEFQQLQEAYSTIHKGKTVQGKNGSMVVPDIITTPGQAAEAEAIMRASVNKKDSEEQEINKAQILKDRQININVNKGRPKTTAESGGFWADKAAAAISTNDATKIADAFADLHPGNGSRKFVNVEVVGDEIVIMHTPRGGSTKKLEKIKMSDKYLRQKLAGIYQEMMGSDIKGEKNDYEFQEGGGQPPTEPEKPAKKRWFEVDKKTDKRPSLDAFIKK